MNCHTCGRHIIPEDRIAEIRKRAAELSPQRVKSKDPVSEGELLTLEGLRLGLEKGKKFTFVGGMGTRVS
jgi:hypothetical protein